jgi:hypothetical protein
MKTNKEKNRIQTLYRKNKDFGLLRKYKLIRRRCYSKTCDHYKWYGKKGIKVEWTSYISFRQDMFDSYLKHLNKFGKEDTTIDRINSSKNYNKENCKWSTRKEQHLTQSGRGKTKQK